jgi:6-pyruvoyltetrahydropterin/6-carboxytetrahydropterin synthase
MLKLHTEFTFDSAHYLNNYKGKCRFCHGHTYCVRIWIKGKEEQIKEDGILFDFGNVKILKDMLDHKYLNKLEYFRDCNPTAENISLFIFNYLKNNYPGLFFKIRLYETKVGKKCYCEVEG